MAQRDPHEVLGVDRDASQATVKAAWRRLAREHHPDLAGDAAARRDATRRMAEINAAYQALRAGAGGRPGRSGTPGSGAGTAGSQAPGQRRARGRASQRPAAAATQPAGHRPFRHDAPLPAAQRDDDPCRGRIPAPAAGAARAPSGDVGRGRGAAGVGPDRPAAARPGSAWSRIGRCRASTQRSRPRSSSASSTGARSARSRPSNQRTSSGWSERSPATRIWWRPPAWSSTSAPARAPVGSTRPMGSTPGGADSADGAGAANGFDAGDGQDPGPEHREGSDAASADAASARAAGGNGVGSASA